MHGIPLRTGTGQGSVELASMTFETWCGGVVAVAVAGLFGLGLA